MNAPALAPWLDRHPPASVLVFRALQVGDMLCAVPALAALRHRLPHAHVALVGLPWAHQFARRFAQLVDEFIPFPGHPALPERSGAAWAFPEFRDAVRRRRFDLALQLHGSGRVTNALVADFGAVWQAGFEEAPTGCGAPFLRYPERGHEIHRLLALTTHLGAASTGDRLQFPLLANDANELAAAGLPLPEGPYVCLHPGARDPARRWPVARFAELGDALAGLGLQVVLTGSADERPLADEVGRAMRAPAINAASAISLGAMAQLMAASRLLVANDTGVSHIACGLSLASVIVFRASDMARWAPLDAARHRAVWDPDGVRAADVRAEALDLLERVSASSASA